MNQETISANTKETHTFACDFETYYDKQCSIKVLGTQGYFNHPDFDAYMVSVWGSDGTRFVGDPRQFDWSLFEGNRVLSHNASFDEAVYMFGVTKGWWSKVKYQEWLCTADMTAFLGMPRNLKGASKEAFGADISKDVRDNMAVKHDRGYFVYPSLVRDCQQGTLDFRKHLPLLRLMREPNLSQLKNHLLFRDCYWVAVEQLVETLPVKPELINQITHFSCLVFVDELLAEVILDTGVEKT